MEDGRRAAVLLLMLSAAGLLLWCAPVFAHAGIVGRSPGEGKTLREAPERVRLRFNEPVRAELGPLEVYDAGGGRVDLDDARTDPDDATVLEVGLEALPGGDYRVEYRATSLDGHVVAGSYGFAVAAEAEGSPAQGEPERAARETAGGPGRTTYGVLGLGALGLTALALRTLTRTRP